jgi:hypothetical protein
MPSQPAIAEAGLYAQPQQGSRWLMVLVVAILAVAAAGGTFLLFRPGPGSLRVYAQGPDGRELPKLTIKVSNGTVCAASPCVVPGLRGGVYDVHVSAEGYQSLAPFPVQVTAGQELVHHTELKLLSVGSGFSVSGTMASRYGWP